MRKPIIQSQERAKQRSKPSFLTGLAAAFVMGANQMDTVLYSSKRGVGLWRDEACQGKRATQILYEHDAFGLGELRRMYQREYAKLLRIRAV